MRARFALALVVLAAPGAASAQLAVGARVGWGIPAGDAYQDPATELRSSVSTFISSLVPLQLDVLYRLRPELAVGVYGSYAFDEVGGAVESACGLDSLSCSARTIRLGVQATYRLRELNPRLFPWVGAGAGWEWTRYEQGRLGTKFQVSLSGIELLALQAGADYRLTERLTIGPYAMVSFGVYTSIDQAATGFGSRSLPLDERLHEWFSIGLRGWYGR